jgi:hypothetical protein
MGITGYSPWSSACWWKATFTELMYISMQHYLFKNGPMSCVRYVASFSGLSFLIAPSVFSNVYLIYCIIYLISWPLCCLFFFGIRILLTPLVYSNSSSVLISHLGFTIHIAQEVYKVIIRSMGLCVLIRQNINLHWNTVITWFQNKWQTTGGLLVPQGIIHPVVSVSVLTLFIIFIY